MLSSVQGGGTWEEVQHKLWHITSSWHKKAGSGELWVLNAFGHSLLTLVPVQETQPIPALSLLSRKVCYVLCNASGYVHHL